MNCFNDLKSFVNIRQRTLERDNGYIKRERSEIETLILSGGCHVLCSPEIMEAADQANQLEKETTSEDEEFSTIHLLQTSGPFRCGNLNKKLQNGLYLVRDKYLTTSGGAYELMIRRSGIYNSIVNNSNVGRRGN